MRNLGVEVDAFHLRTDRDWRPDLAEPESVVKPTTKLVYLVNPNNPVGTVLTDAEVDAIAAARAKVGAWLIVDEVYRGTERLTDVGPALPGAPTTASSRSAPSRRRTAAGPAPRLAGRTQGAGPGELAAPRVRMWAGQPERLQVRRRPHPTPVRGGVGPSAVLSCGHARPGFATDHASPARQRAGNSASTPKQTNRP
ncbi:aminotransferase class I/II-fold pyridoxal phosphate-dependent enzyme [Streptomyces sp. NPDC056660]|uniref:aminotransferase class I/II-fold pyridoxal phosphate-dependent enzyme n=1 Tax=Streptomyces sp. NPDC056660 TaxID=3345897 RepID=UPI00368E38D8